VLFFSQGDKRTPRFPAGWIELADDGGENRRAARVHNPHRQPQKSFYSEAVTFCCAFRLGTGNPGRPTKGMNVKTLLLFESASTAVLRGRGGIFEPGTAGLASALLETAASEVSGEVLQPYNRRPERMSQGLSKAPDLATTRRKQTTNMLKINNNI
jgi:hypothetical protein